MEETENIIEVQDVTMRFNLSEERTDTLKEYFIKLVSGRLHYTPFLALDRVSFRVKRGEALALIGKNGSGKSTMLKILAGVLYPTEGAVKVKGTIAPLIELGAGFDLELTGRENIYMNGAILGHDRQFMDLHFQEIVDFSELDDFIDVPLKNYSSGMIARLGFSVATIVKADILVVDEVLAVPAAVYVLGTLLRAAINRPRPYEALNFTPLFPKDTKGQSMPSRHCFSAAAIVAAAFTVWVPLGVAACLLAAVVAVTRVLTGVHYPSDVLAGLAFGAGAAVIGFLL